MHMPLDQTAISGNLRGRIQCPRYLTRIFGLLECTNQKLTVPGLRDNAQLEIRRGRMRLHGTDLRMIFEPILNTILKLVMKQVKASKNAVKAVLLVGGFGQSAYLRDTLRQEVKNYNENADVMQSPNG